MDYFCIKEVPKTGIESELKEIGFDNSYIPKACDKFRYKNLKIYGLSSAQANILKQTALSLGTDCAVNRDVVTGKAEKSDVILCGSVSHLNKIADKLKYQPFKLAQLSRELKKILELKHECKTQIAGILNVTPDSFSDGGKYYNPSDAINQLMKLIEDGADIIDIGAESTRPYSEPVEAEEQICRLRPVLEFIAKENIKLPISIDTRSAEVADYALTNGSVIINDVSGFDCDSNMPKVVSKHNASVIIQHSKGSPQNMQNRPCYNNVIEEIFFSLKSKIETAREEGINNIIIDSGIGFGKSREHNFEILNRIEEFYALGCPVMIGVSRKSLLGISDNDNDLKDAMSAALAYSLILKNVDFLRVHNVKLHKSLLNLV